MGSLDQHCSSPSFTWSIHIIWTPGINLQDDTQATDNPDGSACSRSILLTPFGLTPTWVLVLSRSTSLHGVIVLVPKQASTMQYEWNIERERTRLLSQPRFPEIWNEYCVPGCAMSCISQSLLSKNSEMRRQSGGLYSQTPHPFWWAMACCIAIGSRAAAEPLVSFLVLHEPMDVQFHCVIIKRLQLKRKKLFFPIQASLTQYSFHISGNV